MVVNSSRYEAQVGSPFLSLSPVVTRYGFVTMKRVTEQNVDRDRRLRRLDKLTYDLEVHQQKIEVLSRERSSLILDLNAHGYSTYRLAAETGLSAGRIVQIIKRERGREGEEAVL